MTLDESDTVRDILKKVEAHYNISHPLHWEDIPDSASALHILKERTPLTVDDEGMQYRIVYDHATGKTGVYRNVALNGATQRNTGAGPGASTNDNRAEGQDTEQTNISICAIL